MVLKNVCVVFERGEEEKWDCMGMSRKEDTGWGFIYRTKL